MEGLRSINSCRCIVFFVIAGLFISCGNNNDAPPEDEPRTPHEFEEIEWPEDEFEYEVEWGAETTLVDEGQLAMVLEADTEEHVYRLDRVAAEAAGLDLSPGRVLVIHGLALRRIVTAIAEDDEVVVTTEFAALPDAIEEGIIGWDYGVEFSTERIQEIILDGEAIEPDDEGHIRLELDMQAYKVIFEMQLRGDRADVNISAEKTVGGTVTGRLTARGTIMQFRSRERIVISGGELQEFNTRLDHMRGDVDLALTVAASGDDFIDFSWPVPIIRFVFPVGGVPVLLNIKAQFVINMVIPFDGSSQVRGGFTYDSSLGLQYRGLQVESSGRLDMLEMSSDTHETGASSPISSNFGVGFPRVELGLFGEFFVPWIQVAYLIGGSFTMLPPCQTADMLLLGAAGYNLRFFKLPAGLTTTTFFSETRELLRAGDCPPQ